MNRELPILFNTDMVRAIIEERKTVTRRLIKKSQCMNLTKKEPSDYLLSKKDMNAPYNDLSDAAFIANAYKPQYNLGDILYVRETWCSGYDGEIYFYLADKNTNREQKQLINYDDRKWHPSIHMPKEAARIWIKVRNVRVERLQDMNIGDFLAEGVVIRPEAFNDPDNARLQAQTEFINIWDSTIKKSENDLYGWKANPWVWVIEFERIEPPVPI